MPEGICRSTPLDDTEVGYMCSQCGHLPHVSRECTICRLEARVTELEDKLRRIGETIDDRLSWYGLIDSGI